MGTLKCDDQAEVRWFTLKCEGVPNKEETLKCADLNAPKCDGVPYKKETLKCDGVTRQSAIVSPIRKKRRLEI